jgi:membrane fusion protein (multidrug efflux system)
MSGSKKHLNLLVIFTIIAFGITIIAGCAKKPEEKPHAVPVKVQKAQLQDVESTTEYVGAVISRKSTDLKPRVDGLIDAILVKDGDFVKKGSVIMTIESSKQGAAAASAVQKANSALSDTEQARATLESLEAQKEAAKIRSRTG